MDRPNPYPKYFLKKYRRPFLPPLIVFLFVASLVSTFAQVRVDLSFKRNSFLAYEPIIANVTIENSSGRELTLEDKGSTSWFGFEIEMPGGRLIPPRNRSYVMPPLTIPPGQSRTRAINLTPLYPLSEFGTYKIKANIFVEEAGRYFSSSPSRIDVTDGKTLWQKKVGVVDSNSPGQLRLISLLQFKLPQSIALYLRIEDVENGIIYCTHRLGRTVNLSSPDVELDTDNNIHTLQLAAPGKYLYSYVNLDGRVLDQKVYAVTKTRPALAKDAHGYVQVIGGEFEDPANTKQEVAPASVTDQPVPLPTPRPAKKKSSLTDSL